MSAQHTPRFLSYKYYTHSNHMPAHTQWCYIQKYYNYLVNNYHNQCPANTVPKYRYNNRRDHLFPVYNRYTANGPSHQYTVAQRYSWEARWVVVEPPRRCNYHHNDTPPDHLEMYIPKKGKMGNSHLVVQHRFVSHPDSCTQTHIYLHHTVD